MPKSEQFYTTDLVIDFCFGVDVVLNWTCFERPGDFLMGDFILEGDRIDFFGVAGALDGEFFRCFRGDML